MDAVTGFGDAASFGATGAIRGALGIGGVNTCSAAYYGGMAAGMVTSTLATGGGSLEVRAADEAYNIANGAKLAEQLALESARETLINSSASASPTSRSAR